MFFKITSDWLSNGSFLLSRGDSPAKMAILVLPREVRIRSTFTMVITRYVIAQGMEQGVDQT